MRLQTTVTRHDVITKITKSTKMLDENGFFVNFVNFVNFVIFVIFVLRPWQVQV